MNKASKIKKYLEANKNDPKVKDLYEKVKNMSEAEINQKLSSKQGSDMMKQAQGLMKQLQGADEKKRKELLEFAENYIKNLPPEKKRQMNQILKNLKK